MNAIAPIPFAAVAAVALSSCALAARQELNGFDISNALIPTAEILAGGPPRDGIPSIDKPRFASVESTRFLKPNDQVVSVTIGGETRAYPLRILNWHEIVNDTIAGTPVAVTYCPLCGTAMVFGRKYRGRTVEFGVSGLLYLSDVLMYDRETESLWSQLGLRSVAGTMAGEPLDWIPAEQLTWESWRAKHPGGRVLTTKTGHRRDYRSSPYERYESSPRTMFPVPAHRDDLPWKEWIVGIIVGGKAKAYRLAGLPDNAAFSDNVAGTPLLLKFDASARAFAAVHAETGAAVPHVFAYWFAWQAFYPDTELFTRAP